MNVGSLFSGIGGLDLGLARAGCGVRWAEWRREFRRMERVLDELPTYFDALPEESREELVLRLDRLAVRAREFLRAVVVTHGRHCLCSACAREDWTNPNLAPCGMHGPDCPNVYAPACLAANNRGAG